LLLAETQILSPAFYATLPLWPLLGAALAGLLIAARAKATLAHWPVVLGVGVAAVLAVVFFFDWNQTHPPHADHGDSHAAAAHVQPVSTLAPADEHGDGHGHAHGDHGIYQDPGFTYTIYNWISLGARQSAIGLPNMQGQWLAANFYFDGLTGIMLLFFTTVALMVVIYAIGYMRDHHGHPEVGYERFFAFLGLFVFSMAMLVMAGNFVLLYLGWELVGLCSYLLIGFYSTRSRARRPLPRRRSSSTASATWACAIGIFLTFVPTSARLCRAVHESSSLEGEQLVAHFVRAPLKAGHADQTCRPGPGAADPGVPDARRVRQERPVPAVRLAARRDGGPDARVGADPRGDDGHRGRVPDRPHVPAVPRLSAVGPAGPWRGSAGRSRRVLAATIGMAQFDIKRIMAYSTVSQLGYMFAGSAC
jgi:NADH-quinone oxidoreductase subunit L